MRVTEQDLAGINSHGFKYEVDEYGCVRVRVPHAVLYIHKRPAYCDRGRFGFHVESTNPEKVWIDFADMFPRYFFSLQRAFDELNDWALFNAEKLGLKEEEEAAQ